MNRLLLAIYILTMPLISCNLFASDPNEADLSTIYGDEEIVSIATGASQPISKAPAVASIISALQIKEMGATNVDDVLESIPGLHVSAHTIGYNPIYTFRGIHSDFNAQVLMLVNGIPLTNLFHGDRNLVWGEFPVESISRIEIIRGPGSAIYGADAFSGVINIITKNAAETGRLSTGARHGRFNTSEWWISTSLDSTPFVASAHLEFHNTNGHNQKISSDVQTFLDSFTGTSASFTPRSVNLQQENYDLRFKLEYEDTLTANLGYQKRVDMGTGVGISQALDPFGEVSGDRYNFDLTYDNIYFTENAGLKAQISYLNVGHTVDRNFILFPPGSTGPFFDQFGQPLFGIFPNGVIGNPEVFERHYRGNVTGNYRGLQDHDITVGAGYYFGDVYKTEEEKNFGINPYTGLPIDPAGPLVDVSDTDAVFLPEDNRENTYVYIQDAWHFADDWELTIGARFDHYSDFGDTVNPRLALVWSTRHNLTTKFLYGEAFRAPSFAETRVQSNPSFLGNSALEPETLKSYEIAFNYRPTFDLALDLNLFRYEWSNIIHFVPDNSGATSTAQNAGRQTGSGLEFEAKWSATDTVDVVGNLAWQKSTDKEADKDAANAPEKQIYARVNWDFLPNYSANIQANWVMDRNRDYRDPRKAIDDYVLVDLTLRRTNLFGNFELALLARNIFDKDAREPTPNGEPVPFIPDDLPLAGRSLLGEIRYKF